MPITAVSNQLSGLSLARSFTAVGLSRTSMGPAINVIVRGVAGLFALDITETAISVCTQGWHTASTLPPGPISSRKRMT